jgi:general secretion pathway protein G
LRIADRGSRTLAILDPRSSIFAGESRKMSGRKIEAGFTLLELIITLAIIAVLVGGTVPVARNMIKREKEMELRRNLREIRKAIDAYKVFCDSGQVSPLDKKVDDECYPPTLEILVEGIRPPNKVDEIRRFLRHIPNDPFLGQPDWGLRSVQDEPDSAAWGGQNVFDVYSKAPGTALDGSKYSDW